MVGKGLQGTVEMQAGVRTVVFDAGGKPYGESLLVGIEVENVALPINPGIQMECPGVVKELEPHFRVCGQA